MTVEQPLGAVLARPEFGRRPHMMARVGGVAQSAPGCWTAACGAQM
jgi:hypothetical protein